MSAADVRILHRTDLRHPQRSGPDADGVDARSVLAHLLHNRPQDD